MKASNLPGIPHTLILVFSAATVAFCQPISNEQIVISSVKSSVQKEIDSDSTTAILVITKGEGIEKLVEEGIAEALQGKFQRVITDKSPDSQYKNLNYSMLGFDFSYKKGSSRGVLKSRRIKREFRCQFRINLMGDMNTVLLGVHEISVDYQDEIEPSDLNLVKSRVISELAPQAPGSGWSRYVEPSLVLASVGILVYLFFANR